MENLINKLIEKYEAEWNRYGMGSGISYSKLISDLKKEREQLKAVDLRNKTELRCILSSDNPNCDCILKECKKRGR